MKRFFKRTISTEIVRAVMTLLLTGVLALSLPACSSSGKGDNAAGPGSETGTSVSSGTSISSGADGGAEDAEGADGGAKDAEGAGSGAEDAEGEEGAGEAPAAPQGYGDQASSAQDNVISFETTDLEGNPVKTADIFSKNKVTMVNIWGTFCGPCINEMPDLEILNGRLADKGCGIIGVVCDVTDASDEIQIRNAQEIIAETGVTYLNLVPWDGFDQDLPAMFVPTTYFIDSSGQIVGEAAIGARGADEYEALLDAILTSLE